MDKKNLSSDKPVGLVLNVNCDPRNGMLESAYGAGFAGELEEDGFEFERDATMPTCRKGRKVKPHYCVDLLINGKMIVELKGDAPDSV